MVLNAHMRAELDTPVGGYRWVPTWEALAILEQLAAADTSLALLHETQARRRRHSDCGDGVW